MKVAARQALSGVLCALLLALSACGRAEPQGEPPPRDVFLQATPEAPVVHLRIPAYYISDLVGWWEPHMPKQAPSETKTDELLFATWPGLEGKTPKNRELFRKAGGPWITILITALDPVRAPSATYMRFRYLQAREANSNPYDHPELLVTYPERFGLHVEGMPLDHLNEYSPSGALVRSRDQVFTPIGQQDDPDTVITCTAEDVPEPEDVPTSTQSPGCDLYYLSPSLHAVVLLGFRRKHLPEWQALRERVDALLNSFVVTPVRP